jgi:hypothetical protein
MRRIDNSGLELEARRNRITVEALATVIAPAWVAEATAAITVRNRKLPARLMAWFLVLMGLFRQLSYENLLVKLEETWLGREVWGEDGAPGKSAIPEARYRLGVAPLRVLFDRAAGIWVGGSRGLIAYGRRVFGLDGTTVKVSDTPANERRFGRPGSSRGRAAYPQLRTVKLVDVETRLVRDVEYGPYRQGELTLARRLLQRLEVGVLLLLDRGFQAYDFLFALKHDRMADFVVRVKKNTRCRVREALAPGDEIVDVQVSRSARRSDPRLPKFWSLRRITYRVAGKTVELLTTVLDAAALPREEIALLYHERWECETTLGEIKTYLCGCTTVNRPVVLRSQTPSAAIQELLGLLISYNAVRKLVAVAAAAVDIEPRRISFVAAVERIRESFEAMSRARTEALPRLYRVQIS